MLKGLTHPDLAPQVAAWARGRGVQVAPPPCAADQPLSVTGIPVGEPLP
jgi:hypothetical protein